MNRLLPVGVLAALCVGMACTTSPKKLESEEAVTDNCKGVPKLKWQVYDRGLNAKETLDLATKLTVAAQVDASKSKELSGAGKVDASVTSELAKLIQLSVKQGSTVSQDFWEQDLRYRQSLCFLDEQSRRSDLTPEQKKTFLDEIAKFTEAQRTYMFGLQKKTGAPRP